MPTSRVRTQVRDAYGRIQTVAINDIDHGAGYSGNSARNSTNVAAAPVGHMDPGAHNRLQNIVAIGKQVVTHTSKNEKVSYTTRAKTFAEKRAGRP